MATFVSLISSGSVVSVAAIAFLFMIVVSVVDVSKNVEKLGD